MKRTYFRFIIIVSLLISVSSCTVHEDRTFCPCWIDFHLDECVGVSDTVMICGYRNHVMFSDLVEINSASLLYYKDVYKGFTHTYVFSGADKSYNEGTRMIIPLGQQADSLFLHNNYLDCTRETARDVVDLHKQWTTVDVKLDLNGELSNTFYRLLKVVVRSDVNGLNLIDGTPIYGEFRYEMEVSSKGFLSFRLPRHSKNSEQLYMDIFKEDKLIESIHLSNALELSGFSWETDLP